MDAIGSRTLFLVFAFVLILVVEILRSHQSDFSSQTTQDTEMVYNDTVPLPEYPLYIKKKLQPLSSLEKNVCTKSDVVLRNSQPRPSAGCQNNYKQNGISLLCVDPVEISCKFPLSKARDHFYRYMESVTVHCDGLTVLGNEYTGGQWEVCLSPPFYPSKDSCLVYSFGIGNEWSFDDAISQQYGCEVHSFDPTMGAQDHNRSNKITFHNFGLAGHGEKILKFYRKGWKMMRLKEIITHLGHSNRVIDILKIDVEYAEWDALEEALKSNALRNVKQIATEFHVWTERVQCYVRFHRIVAALENAGFEKWFVRNLGHFIEAISPKTGVLRKYDTQKNVGFINRHFLDLSYP